MGAAKSNELRDIKARRAKAIFSNQEAKYRLRGATGIPLSLEERL